ncbi:MAG TPA: protein kinase [Polyangiaceae bacterium]|jgi:serine/threonine-protein kinase|nr:protein kinase [Polyangiaceae bacterium]
MALEIGQLIEDKYRVVRLIGEGGMGAVYEGENLRIRRRVAIKTLHANIARNQQVVMRFEREAQAAGRIGSDHILEVLDLGALPGGDRFIVMEYLDGESLSARLARAGRLTAAQLLPIVKQVLTGLGAAHAAGIVHRDLKPDNVYILRQKAGIADYVKIIDFGISKFHNDQQGSAAMTLAGSIMGTPLYMSPEQANGSAEADARSDIYSVGVIMFESLSGTTPFTSQNLNELLFKIVLSDIPRLETLVHGIEPSIASIVAKATSKKREDRFASAQEMMAALDAARVTLPPLSVPLTPGPSWRSPPAATVPVGTPAPVGTPVPATQHVFVPTPPPVAQFTPSGPVAQPPWREPGHVTGPTGTSGAWGNQSQAPATRSKAPLVAGVAMAALFVLVAGGLAVTRVINKPKATEGALAPSAPSASQEAVAAATTAGMVPTSPPDPPAVTLAPPSSATLAPPPSASSAPVVVPPRAGPSVAVRPAEAPKPVSITPAPHAKAPKKPDWGY